MHVTALVSIAFGAAFVPGQAVTPLASKRFRYPDGISYRIDTGRNLSRGDQLGYNI
ncbi:hypothetical protein BJ165DRAFT_1501730 [Panaeolus papilionaceus]|nr:hypothetical protein BJ165DRAFT_1501730 [Panaeolus papilionaceus]